MAEDTLALSLERAAADPAHKPEFARVLLSSVIFVMGEIEGEDPVNRPQTTLKAGSRVSLRSQQTADGRTVVPFFSSFEKLTGFVEGNQVNYLQFPARVLFEIAKGATLVLNPGSRVSGEIAPEDVARLQQVAGDPGKDLPRH